jgi:hypothetical protein
VQVQPFGVDIGRYIYLVSLAAVQKIKRLSPEVLYLLRSCFFQGLNRVFAFALVHVDNIWLYNRSVVPFAGIS